MVLSMFVGLLTSHPRVSLFIKLEKDHETPSTRLDVAKVSTELTSVHFLVLLK